MPDRLLGTNATDATCDSKRITRVIVPDPDLAPVSIQIEAMKERNVITLKSWSAL